ncbi:MAG: hypothetical protein ACOC2Y_07190 [Spirochaetota bacterium]
MIPSARSILIALFVACACGSHAEELVIGGEVSVRLSATVSPRLEERVLPSVVSEYTSIASAFGESVELRASLNARNETAHPAQGVTSESSVGLEELHLSATIGPRLTLDAGLFPYRMGSALLLSPNDLFSALSFSDIVSGNLSGPAAKHVLVQATVFVPAGFVTATIAPIPSVPVLVEPDSVWIPRPTQAGTIDDPRFAEEPLELNDVVADPTRPIDHPLERFSAGIVAGVTLGPVDLTAIAYHGVDPTPVARVRVDVPHVPAESYNLHIAPDEAAIDSFGITVDGVAGALGYHLDAAFVPNKTLPTTVVDAYSKRTKVVEAPFAAAVAGATYALDRVPLRVAAEYYHSHAFLPADTDAETVLTGPLACDLFLSADYALGENGDWRPSVAGIVSFDDRSGAVLANLSYSPSASFETRIQAPLFLGSEESDFGQFRDVAYVTLALTYRF